jgi:DNA-binding NarL/FixJ family response regulator
VRVLILEDEPYWRETIERIFSNSPHFEVLAVCRNLKEALRTIRDREFDLLIADLGLPDGSGIDAIRATRRLRPAADVLVATVFADQETVVSAVCAGATGYILKDSAPADWIKAIEDLSQGRSPLSPRIARHILRMIQEPSRSRRFQAGADRRPAPAPSSLIDDIGLTSRELEVLRLVAKGFSLVEVAQLLHVSHTTTRSHAKSIYSKLEVNSRGEAVFEAHKLGLI